MTIALEPFDSGNRPVVERLWQLFKHDLSEVTGALPDAEGRFSALRLPRYFDGSGGTGFLVRQGGLPAGFCSVLDVGAGSSMMGDFFVLRTARRHGVGTTMAGRLLASRPGCWAIPFQAANTAGAAFWRGVATAAAGTAWTEERLPVAGRPEVPPDVWLRFTVAA